MLRHAVTVVLLLVPFAGAVAADSPPRAPIAPRAPAEKTFLIPSGEGYGVADCLTQGESECGRVVANAWCEAQGYAAAGAYGLAARDEYTGAIEVPAAPTERPVRIVCKD